MTFAEANASSGRGVAGDEQLLDWGDSGIDIGGVRLCRRKFPANAIGDGDVGGGIE